MSYEQIMQGKSQILDQEEKDRPTFVLPYCNGDGTFVFYEGLWLSKVVYPSMKIFKDIQEFQFKDDILVSSFPKSGTTWVQEIVSQIEILYMEDGEKWKLINIEDRFPYLEYVHPGIKEIAKIPPPRLLKTHLPYHLLPPSIINGVKTIYVARDLRDASVSFYHFHKMLRYINYKGTFKEFFDYFISGRVWYGPWDMHVLSYWEKRDNKNLLFLTYENMHREPHKVIKEISKFIGKPITDEQLVKIAEVTKFDKMKGDSSTNYSWWDDNGLRIKTEAPFFRKGIVGDWTNYFDESMLDKVEELFRVKPALREIFADELNQSS